MLDVVLAHGRALDPETGLDGVRHVGIKGGRIACVVDGAAPVPEAARVVDCSDLCVAPGFIDIHSHGAGHGPTARAQALDGVTTHLELGLGCSDVGEWLRCRAGGQLLHYGVAAGFSCCRAAAFADRTNEPGSPGGPASPPPRRRSGRMTDEMMERRRSRNNSMTTTCEVVRYDPHHDEPHLSSACFCCGNASASQRSDPRTGRRVLSRLDDGLRDGALGVALCLRYVPGADAEEVLRCFDAAARWGAAVFATPRAGAPAALGDLREVVACAAATGAPAHVLELGAGAPDDLPLLVELLDRSRRTVDVTGSRGPFGADLYRLDSPVFAPGFEERLRLDDPGRVAWLATGEKLTAESLERKRALVGPGKAEHGLVSVAGARGDAMLLHPPALVASGCPPVDDGGEPSERAARTFSSLLGGLARDRGLLSTLEALAKMTLHPALRLEHACAAFRAKGRLQVGCDADVAVFDDRRRRVAFRPVRGAAPLRAAAAWKCLKSTMRGPPQACAAAARSSAALIGVSCAAARGRSSVPCLPWGCLAALQRGVSSNSSAFLRGGAWPEQRAPRCSSRTSDGSFCADPKSPERVNARQAVRRRRVAGRCGCVHAREQGRSHNRVGGLDGRCEQRGGDVRPHLDLGHRPHHGHVTYFLRV